MAGSASRLTEACTDTSAPRDVFISYRHADRAAADRLYRLLAERRVSVWYDALIPPGAAWRDTIVGHLSGAKLMVILLSAAALESDELKKELAVADQENVPLLAVRLENVKPRDAFAYELARGNWFDVFGNPEERLVELADALAGLVRDASRIPAALETSVLARRERRLREAWGRWAPLRRPSVLAILVAVVSAATLGLYEWRASPIEQLIAGGLEPLTAYSYVAIAVTVASPILAISLFRDGLRAADLPLLLLTMTNTILLCSLAAALVRDARLKLHRMLRGVTT